jgi:hypothetical protein
MARTNKESLLEGIIKKFNILPIHSELLLSLLALVVNNTENFQRNSDIYTISTRDRYSLHVLNANLSIYKKRS